MSTSPIKALCVYCGSRPGARPVYLEQARATGHALARRGITLVYGAGSTGMMGGVADGVLEAGGEVVGVIPKGLHRHEQTHAGLTTLHVVDSMHERKALMETLSDGLLTLPGGYGTLDEMFEALTWGVLGIHNKPCGFLNVEGYWDPIIGAIDHMLTEGFISPSYRDMVLMESDIDALIDACESYDTPVQTIWNHEA